MQGLTKLKDIIWKELNNESNKLHDIVKSERIVHRDMDIKRIEEDFTDWDADVEVIDEDEDLDDEEVLEI